MKLKLIDEDWIDKQIKATATLFKDDKNPYTNLLERVKEQLQSPIEEISKAFEAGKEYGKDYVYDVLWTSNTPNLEEYLKQKGYEKD